MNTLLLDISQVDFLDVNAVTGFAALIIAVASKERLVMRVSPSPAAGAIAKVSADWIRGVNGSISRLTDGDRLKALECYDWIHRIALHMPADNHFLNKHILTAFDARISGDKTVDEYLLFKWVYDALERRHDQAFFGKPLKWYSMILGEWVKTSQNGSIDRLPLNKAVCIASVLLGSDLFAYISRQDTFKDRLARHFIARTSSLENLDTETLMALFPFNNALMRLGIEFPALGGKEKNSDGLIMTESNLRRILSRRSDLHPLRRAAFKVEVGRN